MKTFVCGDIHGNYKGLLQCIERSGFDYDNDTLIQLGDVADGWSEVYECVETLLNIRNLISIKGNHDDEFFKWMEFGVHQWNWVQGAKATAESYIRHADREIQLIPSNGGWKTDLTYFDIPPLHREFWKTQHHYYIDDKNRLFIHGGFNRHFPLKEQQSYIYWWDRDLWNSALSYEAMIRGDGLHGKERNKFKIHDNFSEIFIGHTATLNWGKDEVMKAANIYNLDTGSGFGGRLCFMNVDTKECFYSDNVKELYPNEKGRG